MPYRLSEGTKRRSALTLDQNRGPEAGDNVLRQPQFRKRQQERQRGFRALVAVDPVDVQSVATTAGPRRVEFQSEIVRADEPVKRTLGLFVPPGIGRRPIGFQTGRSEEHTSE